MSAVVLCKNPKLCIAFYYFMVEASFNLVKCRREVRFYNQCAPVSHYSSLLYLKKLHSDTSEHELQQSGDDHDVANGPDGHKYTLDHVLQSIQLQCY